jgi:hypothetical protein
LTVEVGDFGEAAHRGFERHELVLDAGQASVGLARIF